MYYAHIKQDMGEGCGYTIACGEKLIPLTGVINIGEAHKALENLIEVNYTGEFALSSATVFTVSGNASINLEALYADIKRRENSTMDQAQEIKDLREFERLKHKLGK